MAQLHQRAFAGFFAVLFLVTASATTIAVIITLVQQHNTDQAAKNATAAATAAQNTSKKTSNSNNKGSSTVNPAKLQGTLLTGFTPGTAIPKLEAIDTVAGTGDVVKPGATVTVDYTGAVAATGTIFQSSKDSGQSVTFPLSSVIPGWTQGIPGMKVGGTRRLLIPANLAYGANPPAGSGIPANADLVFDVTVHKAN
ncbi:MAG: FKBP-type peptidyl-prolyl cis-trans isomerase [Candidatus Saccharimonadales bacterium]